MPDFGVHDAPIPVLMTLRSDRSPSHEIRSHTPTTNQPERLSGNDCHDDFGSAEIVRTGNARRVYPLTAHKVLLLTRMETRSARLGSQGVVNATPPAPRALQRPLSAPPCWVAA